MQRRCDDLHVPFGCPHCDADLTVTLGQLHEEGAVWCSACGTAIPLRPEQVQPPEVLVPPQLSMFSYPL